MYKFHSRDSSKFKGCSSLQLSCNLTGKYNAIGYSIYTNRYMQGKTNEWQSFIQNMKR
jgi:hypothetical protein